MSFASSQPSVVLLYHRIGLPRPSSLVAGQYVAPRMLRAQLDYLARRGWQCVSLPEVAEPVKGKWFSITFDDAYSSVYEHAYPIIRDRGATATVFVVVDSIGGANDWDRRIGDRTEPVVTLEQLKEMAANGCEIGSHTLTHPHLIQLSDQELKREVTESKTKLEDLLGIRVTSFSYPYGECDERVVEACRAAGYERAVTARLGVVAGCDPFQIPRVNVRWNAVGPLLLRKIARAGKACNLDPFSGGKNSLGQSLR